MKKRFRIGQDVIVSYADNKYHLLKLSAVSDAYEVEGTAAVIWSLLIDEPSMADLSKKLEQKYGPLTSQQKGFTKDFLNEMINEKLIEKIES